MGEEYAKTLDLSLVLGDFRRYRCICFRKLRFIDTIKPNSHAYMKVQDHEVVEDVFSRFRRNLVKKYMALYPTKY